VVEVTKEKLAVVLGIRKFQCFLVQISLRAQNNVLRMLVYEKEVKSGFLCLYRNIPATDVGKMRQCI